MTTEEIKDRTSMRSIVEGYGLHPNRAGFILCPFHHEKGHASLKLYDKDFHCFGCGANGDVFDFVAKMDGCDFKTAFLKLGGAYKPMSSWQRKRFEYEQQKRKEAEQKRKIALAEERRQIYDDIAHHKRVVQYAEVFSDPWCESTNALERLFLRLEEMEKRKND